MKKKEIQAVHEQDLDRFLQSLGLLDDLLKSRLKCAFCGVLIDKENFRCVFPAEGQIRICCGKIDCVEKAPKVMESA